jgi:hypothetical protein
MIYSHQVIDSLYVSTTNEWIRKMWYKYKMGISHKEEQMSFAGKQMGLESIMLREKSQTQKDKSSRFILSIRSKPKKREGMNKKGGLFGGKPVGGRDKR